MAQVLIGSPEKIGAPRMHEIGLLSEVCEAALWPQRVQQILTQVTQVPAPTRARVLQAMHGDTRDQDMADLVATASHPDIKQRIAAYLGPPRV